MHRALCIQEVLQLIFQHFLPESYFDALSYTSHGPFDLPDEYGRSTALSLALTCRAFRDPALNVLWWAMDDLTPLLALLKGYKVIEDESGKQVKVIRGTVSTQERETLSVYSRRIKLFHFFHHHDIPITSLLQLLQATGRPILMPSLKYLLCEVDAPELLCFLSPTLREVKAFFKTEDGPARHFRSLVGSLPLSAPRIIGLSSNYDMSQECLETISMLSSLQYLNLGNSRPNAGSVSSTVYLGPRFVKELHSSSSSTLSHLSIYGEIDILIGMPPDSSFFAFAALEEIDLRPATLKNAQQLTDLFRMIACPNLRSLKIFNYDFTDAVSKSGSWRGLVKSLVQAAPNLQRLKLRSHGIQTGLLLNDVPEILNLALLALEESILDVVTPADIGSMASAWPQLSDLYLGSRIGADTLTAISLHFSALQHLDIFYDWQYQPNVETIPILANPVASIFLRNDSVLPPDNPLDFALFFDRLFPYIKTWQAYGAGGVHPHPQWRRIGEILRVMHRSKSDQRVRDKNGISRPQRKTSKALAKT